MKVNVAPTKFENALRLVSPAMAERRYASRIAFETRAAFSAADVNRNTGGWRGIGDDLNGHLRADRLTIARRARFLAFSTSHGTAAITGLRDATIGTGINALCQAEFAGPEEVQHALRMRANDARRTWNEHCDWERRSWWEDFETTGFNELIVDGNVFLREMIEPEWRSRGMRIPLTYQMLRAERLTTASAKAAKGNEVFNGVEVDKHGRTVAFHFAGEGYRYVVERVPAGEVIHGMRMDYPGQHVGLSWMAPVIPEMQQYEEVKTYAIIARKVQSAIALIVSSDANGNGGGLPGLGTQTPAKDANQTPMRAIEAGMIHNVGSGKVHSHVPSPSNDTDVLSKLLLRSMGIGMGCSYEQISGDYSTLNFAGGRLGVLANRKRVSCMHAMYCRRVELPVHRRFVQFSREFDRDYPRALANDTAVRFSRPKFDLGVNPVQEVRAMTELVKNGFSSLENEVGSLGGDWSQVATQIDREIDFYKFLNMPTTIHPALEEEVME